MPDESPPTPLGRYDERAAADSDVSDAARSSRRSFLASAGTATAGLAATAGLGTTAGCVEVLPAMGRKIRFDDVEPPEAAPPRYREWAPAPAAGGDEVDLDLEFVAIPNSDVESVTGVRAEYGRGFLAGGLDYFGVGFGNYDLGLWLAGGSNDVYVLEGPIAPAEVGPVLLESGYVADGDHRGYDRYVREDVPRTVAVADGRIVFGKGPQRDAAIDVALDARAGDVPRATEEPAFEQITDAAGTRPFLMLGDSFSGLFDDYELDRFVVGVDFDGSAFYYCHYFRFTDEVPSRGGIQDQVESMDLGEAADRVGVERDGQFVSVVIQATSDVVQSDLAPVGTAPHCTWGIEADDGEYRIVHEAGEPAPAEQLSVHDGWADGATLDTQFADEYATVGPGDSIRVPADMIEEGPLTIVWETESSSATLLEYRP